MDMKKILILQAVCVFLAALLLGGVLFQFIQQEDGVEYVSSAQKAKWKKPLLEALSEVPIEYSEATIMPSCAVGLLEVDFATKMPELIVIYPGGSAGNCSFQIISLETGEEIGNIESGWYSDYSYGFWGTYRNREDGMYSSIGSYNHRIGWSTRKRMTSLLEYKEGKISKTTSFLTLIDQTQYQLENDDSFELENDAYFYLDGKELASDEYYNEYEDFSMQYFPVEDTELLTYQWSDLEVETKQEKIETMAELLLNSSQRFVKF